MEQRHYKEDSDCVTAKVPLGDLDLYDGTFISLESKGIKSVWFCVLLVDCFLSHVWLCRSVPLIVLTVLHCSPEDYVDFMSPLPPDLEKPDCAEILDLPYSIHAFQHLRVIILSQFAR